MKRFAIFNVVFVLAAGVYAVWLIFQIANPAPDPAVPLASDAAPLSQPIQPAVSAQEVMEPAVPAKSISAPPPIKAAAQAPQTLLTSGGTIIWTNVQRILAGLTPLAENQQLNAAASAKVADMFAQQYFEHVSPSGTSAGDLAQDAGYAFIAIGENLALGNFGTDEKLVAAWMASPGHKANILNPKYAEIGVAVGSGTFEGHATWLAVQEFGKPLADCPQPDQSIKANITAQEAQVEQIAATLKEKKGAIENTPKRDPAYNEKVDAYNTLVQQYNSQLSVLKEFIAAYNAQVSAFNQCLGS